MKLILDYGANWDPELLLASLTAAGLELESAIKRETWPDDWELHAAGDLDLPTLQRAVGAVAAALCPAEVMISVRIVREPNVADLLYKIPCDDWEKAIEHLPDDIRAYREGTDSFRHWFRRQWMGWDDENTLTWEELSSEPLTAERILAYLDPPIFRDWRPIQSYVERHARCRQLVEAMEKARTPRQKWRLAYAFHRRGRSCEGVIPHLIGWLSDADRQVREEAADSLGRVVLAVRHHGTRASWGRLAGEALLAHVIDHPDDNLYFARTTLGAMGYEPARPYLEDLAENGSGQRQQSAEIALDHMNEASLTGAPALKRRTP